MHSYSGQIIISKLQKGFTKELFSEIKIEVMPTENPITYAPASPLNTFANGKLKTKITIKGKSRNRDKFCVKLSCTFNEIKTIKHKLIIAVPRDNPFKPSMILKAFDIVARPRIVIK